MNAFRLASGCGIIDPCETDDFGAYLQHVVVYDGVSEAYYGMPLVDIHHLIPPSGYIFSPSQILVQSCNFIYDNYCRYVVESREDTWCTGKAKDEGTTIATSKSRNSMPKQR